MLKQKWVLPALAGLIVVMVVVICLLGRQGSGGGEADFFQEEPGEVEQTTAGNAEALLAKLSTEQKVGQLFLILPDALAEEPAAAGTTTLSAKELKALETYPVGGFVLTGSNIQDKDQMDKLMGRLKKTSSVTPLFALQEEGGMGATIAGKEAFGLAKTETPAALGSTGDGAKVKDAAATIGKALADLGFQMNLAPTCDVGSALSFSESPEQAAMCTSAAVEGFHEGGVACVLKHYPGQGGTNASEGASLTETWNGQPVPSRAFAEGGIHEAIMDYEDAVFFDILAEELARRDMDYAPISNQNYDELIERMDEYMEEFERNGTDRLQVEDL